MANKKEQSLEGSWGDVEYWCDGLNCKIAQIMPEWKKLVNMPPTGDCTPGDLHILSNKQQYRCTATTSWVPITEHQQTQQQIAQVEKSVNKLHDGYSNLLLGEIALAVVVVSLAVRCWQLSGAVKDLLREEIGEHAAD